MPRRLLPNVTTPNVSVLHGNATFAPATQAVLSLPPLATAAPESSSVVLLLYAALFVILLGSVLVCYLLRRSPPRRRSTGPAHIAASPYYDRFGPLTPPTLLEEVHGPCTEPELSPLDSSPSSLHSDGETPVLQDEKPRLVSVDAPPACILAHERSESRSCTPPFSTRVPSFYTSRFTDQSLRYSVNSEASSDRDTSLFATVRDSHLFKDFMGSPSSLASSRGSSILYTRSSSVLNAQFSV
ncbi:hypothetical protein SPRG_00457 [Saprolegnia parasitica CBS 223.65]|uniref:Uncharacterized protein n=1 Tax=Saprolegnia parasitica (strain CBS 223.65) TaxID=695850 RepID=A0A067CYP5_SAPPC|nr:hypothetical protein SPRG_00457 [Saprolegnia parasitica CBS 223.65]KDO35613.1 hypothetical protein SPRG_00457 [Saprolegnia parasitica CBS 223.65]|eukprot:XP_012193941.1 hypothetical protein SPRG_00457 [Saprolegnia parasitica CBS 223.65]